MYIITVDKRVDTLPYGPSNFKPNQTILVTAEENPIQNGIYRLNRDNIWLRDADIDHQLSSYDVVKVHVTEENKSYILKWKIGSRVGEHPQKFFIDNDGLYDLSPPVFSPRGPVFETSEEEIDEPIEPEVIPTDT
jgi:hypothetical protein